MESQSATNRIKKVRALPKYLNDDDLANLPADLMAKYSKEKKEPPPKTWDAFTFTFSKTSGTGAPSAHSTTNSATQTDCSETENLRSIPIPVLTEPTQFYDVMDAELAAFGTEFLREPANASTSEKSDIYDLIQKPDSQGMDMCDLISALQSYVLSKNLNGFEEELAHLLTLGVQRHYFVESLHRINVKRPDRQQILEETSTVAISLSSLATPCFVSVGVWLISANAAMCSMLGVSESTLKKRTLMELLHPEDIPMYYKNIIMEYTTSTPIQPFVIRLRKGDLPYLTPETEAVYLAQRKDLLSWLKHVVDITFKTMHTPCTSFITCILSSTMYHMSHIPTFEVTHCIRIDNIPNIEVHNQKQM